tara:strand:- start:223 stop:468 length:246 start_codon:yes stop_codon:yes gene_type:complete
MKTNDLKKGDRCQLRNGWFATMADNMKGNIRCATVEGYETETGSVYAHDIKLAIVEGGSPVVIEHTPAQLKLQATVEGLGW